MSAKRWKCPQCEQLFSSKEKSFPFCSERCQMLDLGAWANEKYRIPARDTDEDGAADFDSSIRPSPEEIEH